MVLELKFNFFKDNLTSLYCINNFQTTFGIKNIILARYKQVGFFDAPIFFFKVNIQRNITKSEIQKEPRLRLLFFTQVYQSGEIETKNFGIFFGLIIS